MESVVNGIATTEDYWRDRNPEDTVAPSIKIRRIGFGERRLVGRQIFQNEH